MNRLASFLLSTPVLWAASAGVVIWYASSLSGDLQRARERQTLQVAELGKLGDKLTRIELDLATLRSTRAPVPIPRPAASPPLLAMWRGGTAAQNVDAEQPVKETLAAAKDQPAAQAAYRKSLDEHFFAERVDPAWGRASEAALTARAEQVLPPDSAIRRCECRASMCRLETSHVSRESFMTFTQAAFSDVQQRPWNGASLTSIVSANDNQVVAVSYVAREGVDLPGMSNAQPNPG